MTIIPINIESVQKSGNVPIKLINKNFIKLNILKKHMLKIAVSAIFIISIINITNTQSLYASVLNKNYNNTNIINLHLVQDKITNGDIFDIIMTYNLSSILDKDYIHFVINFDTQYLKIIDMYGNTDNIVQEVNLFDTISKHKIDQSSSLGMWEFEAFNLKNQANNSKNILSIIRFISINGGRTNLNITLYDKNNNIVEKKNLNIIIN